MTIAFEGVSFSYPNADSAAGIPDRRERHRRFVRHGRNRADRTEKRAAQEKRDHAAVCEVSFSLANPGTLGIAGATGSGKSTLLKLLAGLLEPDSGEIVRTPVNDGTNVPRVGLVFQYPERQLFAQSVREDAAFGPHNLGRSDKQADRDAEWALQIAGIPERLWDRNPFSLSGGEQRRVALAGVLAMRPDILALDEPTAGQDPLHRRNLIMLLERLRNQGISTVLASHDMNLLAHCDQILVMRKGNIAASGTAYQVLSDSAQLASCGLEAPDTLQLASLLKEKDFRLPEGIDTAEALADALAKEL